VRKNPKFGGIPDAQFKGYQDVIVQDSAFRTENVTFGKETYYSPSQKDLSSGSSQWVQRSVWAGSPSLGPGTLLCSGHE
jgi:hypothetical protein